MYCEYLVRITRENDEKQSCCIENNQLFKQIQTAMHSGNIDIRHLFFRGSRFRGFLVGGKWPGH